MENFWKDENDNGWVWGGDNGNFTTKIDIFEKGGRTHTHTPTTPPPPHTHTYTHSHTPTPPPPPHTQTHSTQPLGVNSPLDFEGCVKRHSYQIPILDLWKTPWKNSARWKWVWWGVWKKKPQWKINWWKKHFVVWSVGMRWCWGGKIRNFPRSFSVCL